MKNLSRSLPIATSYFFILLFVYASASKILDFENFQVQIAQSPLLSAYAGIASYGVLIIEFSVAALLLSSNYRLIGFYASYTLMIFFTVYIFLILNYSEFIPCSCGGILEKLGWQEHLIFNAGCIVLAFLAIIIIESERFSGIKKLIIKLTTIFVITCSIMTGLFLSSEHLIKSENNFTRRFLPHPISDERYIDLSASSFYFAGNKGDTIFLGNREAPLLMATVFPDYKNAKMDTLKISEDKLPFKNVELNISYPNYSISDGTIPIIFEGTFPNLAATKITLKPPYFSQLKMISRHHYLFKSVLTESRKSILGSIDTEKDETKINYDLLETQMDGLFDTDGQISIDSRSVQMIYTYLYRNQYFVTDAELLKKNIGNTIDTIKIAQIKLHRMSDGSTKMAAPPLEVNLFQTAFDGLLFNASALRGKFESAKRWKTSRVIDVYNYNDKTYQYSFYIQNREERKARSLLVTKKHLYALIGNELVRYQRRR